LGLNEKIDARDAPVGNDAGEAQGVVPVNLASEPSAVVHRTIRSGLPRIAITLRYKLHLNAQWSFPSIDGLIRLIAPLSQNPFSKVGIAVG
jgi:predicted benzoate:H+ symporter BenE